MTHPLWLAQNLMTHPFVRAQNLVTHPIICSDPPPLYLLTSPLFVFSLGLVSIKNIYKKESVWTDLKCVKNTLLRCHIKAGFHQRISIIIIISRHTQRQ